MTLSEQKNIRPVLDIPATGFERAMDAISTAALLAEIVFALYYWPELPARVVVHFGSDGMPDGWGSKWILLIAIGISVVLYVGMTILRRYPHLYNYPLQITGENAQRMYQIATLFISILKCEMVLLFAYISIASISVALGNMAGLGLVFMPFLLALIFGTIGWYFWKSSKVR